MHYETTASARHNDNKIDLTNLSPTALLPQQNSEHLLIEVILDYVDKGEYHLPLKLFAESYPYVVELAACVMNHGEKVYGYNNWKKGMSKRSIMQSLYRHIHAQYNQEQLYDRDSGLPHIGHIYCNLMFLQYHAKKGFLGDD